MHLTNFHFYTNKNYLYSKPVKGLQSCGIGYRFSFNGKERDNEISGTGNSYDYGGRMQNSRLGRWFSPDIREKEFAGLSPFNYCINNPIVFIDPSGEKPTPYEASVLAKHVYGDKIDLVGGWRVSERIIKDLVIGSRPSGFKAQLYERVKSDGCTEYAYVFAGTEASLKDVGHDAAQIFGLSKQFSQASDNAVVASAGVGDDELTFVGHSLGGGLAALSSFKTGRAAVTFNPSGVSLLTELKHGTIFKTGDNVKNYIAKIEPLNIAQFTVLLPLGLTPSGSTEYIGGASHSINNSVDQLKPSEMHKYDGVTLTNQGGSGMGMIEKDPIDPID